MGLFNMPQHFVIPLFQRPYVWKENEQWEPLWADVRRVAELRMEEPHLNPYHFLGAVVLQSQHSEIGGIQRWNIIDGQQRLTTLQLLTDASCAVLRELGVENLAAQLSVLTHNGSQFVSDGSTTLKIRHLNKDRKAFDEVMTVEPPIDYQELENPNSQISKAHQYFTTVVTEWLGNRDSIDFMSRATQLAHVLLEDLHLVAIQLSAEENSQEIFETLNARGTPLTAADLIRNFVFQRLELESSDIVRAHAEDWPFESDFWAKDISVGRYFVSQSSLFFNHWLTSKIGEELSLQSTFNRFKYYVEHEAGTKMIDLLPIIKRQANLYEEWSKSASKSHGELNRAEMAFYRMNASGTHLLKPLLIWLHDPDRNLPENVIDKVIGIAESWIVRRQILRLPGSDLGRTVAEIIASNRKTASEDLVSRVEALLVRKDVSSSYWPGDAEVREAILNEPIYRRLPRPRLRFILEAIENLYRAETGQSQIERGKLPIEHIMPRKWEEHWGLEDMDLEKERQRRVHNLGNLTLLTRTLNSKVSNSSWETKRQVLLEHNTINLTGRLIGRTEGDTWDETQIDLRTRELTEAILKIWPVPEGHLGEISDPQSRAADSVNLSQLVAAGLISPGTALVARWEGFEHVRATVQADGSVIYGGKRYETPSGAACSARGGSTNGWYFWATEDGRRLRDFRSEYLDLVIHRKANSQ